ncbi:pseudoazurin [Stappia sp. F7233]|uniref:Pseudoazurin n=1 Tax=Stappia albiluteola TaxID=2758565 RepID=A0A839A8P3_9HYPH|nr:pseudoazurin [Stappia albiluteola]MBA5775701.1 pseudoazurin [Stappia albiluteola]
MKTKTIALAIAAVLTAGTSALAADHEVRMLNKGEKGVMVFEPDLIKVAPGDTVTFKATDAGHNAETIKGMLPDGAEPFVGKMGQDVTVTFTQPGVYGIKCKPHLGMGMIAAVVVGEPVNLDAVKAVKNPGKAGKKFTDILGDI